MQYAPTLDNDIKQQSHTQYASLDQFLADVERRALIMAQSATRSREDGLDLVQDSMLAFVKHYSNKPRAEWMPLFYRVLQNHIRDWHRKSTVRNRWQGWFGKKDGDDTYDPIQSAPDPACRTPDKMVALAATSQVMIIAIENLPLRQQQAFFLRTWEGLNVASTAKIMGCSDGSVKTHLSRAMKALRLQLEEHY